jgi:four helix bundle protein
MRGPARTHRDLIVWKEGMNLLVEVYRIADRLPTRERYGLASQLRRAAVSIPTNVAEGFARRSRGDFARFLTIAEGSLRELQTLLEAVPLIGYVDPQAMQPAIDISHRVGFLTQRLRRSISGSPRAPRAPRAP